MIRKILLLALILTQLSCLDDDAENLGFTQLGIFTEVNAPSEAEYNETVTFNVKIKRPYECLKFEQFDLDDSNENYIVVKPILIEDFYDCDLDEQEQLIETSMAYRIDKQNEMKFRFITTKNEDGTYDFIEKVITVTE